MVEYKQPALVRELRRRIIDGVYSGTLPTTIELAAEFGVNPKTMNKAIAQLVAEGRLERRRCSGTRICSPAPASGERLIEVIFEGFTAIFTHPFWGEIWSGMVEEVVAAGFRPVLNMLEADPETGHLDLSRLSLSPAAGRIVLGIADPELLRQVCEAGAPFITACDPLTDRNIPQVTFDFNDAMLRAVRRLCRDGCRSIAFVGEMHGLFPNQTPGKYLAFLRALQECGLATAQPAEHARPLSGLGAPALAAILDRMEPDALIAAYDHQIPELIALLIARNRNLPVIGCDGLPLPGLSKERHTIVAPRRECGRRTARLLTDAISAQRMPDSLALPATFR